MYNGEMGGLSDVLLGIPRIAYEDDLRGDRAAVEAPSGVPYAPRHKRPPKPDGKRWLALAVVLVAAFMDLLDVTIVNVAIPSIQHDLNAGYSAIEWVSAGYALAFAAVLITGGRLGDIYGRKRLFLIGMSGFTIASALSGTAVTPGMLIAARVGQGAMAALMVPQILAIIHVTFPAEERGRVFGLYGAIVGSAAVAGPILGGFFVQWNLLGLHWRPIFLVNIPVGGLGMLAASFFVRESRAPDAPKLDIVGMVLATTSVLLLVYPLTEGRDLGWPKWTFEMMASSVGVIGIFALHEHFLIRRGGTPLVVLGLFKGRSFAGGFGISLLFNLATGTFFLMWTLYLQLGLGWSALHAGLTGIPFSLAVAAAAAVSVQFLTPKYGRRVLVAGGLVMATGAVFYSLASAHYGIAIHSRQMIPPLVVMGIGMGLVVAPVIDFVLTDVPHEAAGSASGVIGMTQQLGTSIGTALVGVVFLSALSGQAGRGVDSVVPRIRHELSAARIPGPVQDAVIAAEKTCARDRAGEKDPSVIPPSCRSGTGQQNPEIARVMADVAPAARAQLFSLTYRRGLGYVAGLLLLVTALISTLPKFAQRQDTDGANLGA